MKLKTLSLFLAFLCSHVLLAQNPKVVLTEVKTVEAGDSVVLTMGLQVDMEDMPSKNQLRLAPALKLDGKQVVLEPTVVLNGKKQHGLYKRKMVLEQRRVGNQMANKEQAYEYKGGNFKTNYRSAVVYSGRLRDVEVSLRCQMIDANGAVIAENWVKAPAAEKNEKVVKTMVTGTPSVAQTTTSSSDVLGDHANDIVELQQDFSVVYKGSYLQPASDAIYERNQRELRFSLDEAKVVAEINPQMLSLRELYAVAKGYEGRPAMFHKIIKISVELYPSNPVANLNAAASAIELKDVDAAATFLQAAPHDTLAYTNCRGAYELMRNNVQDGLRLLKAASAAGSKEATENLKIFFGSFKEDNR